MKDDDKMNEYFDTEEVSKMTKRSPGTLANDRVYKKGIPYIKLGRKVLYSRADVIRYLESHRITHDE